jgi:hypothetical protein
LLPLAQTQRGYVSRQKTDKQQSTKLATFHYNPFGSGIFRCDDGYPGRIAMQRYIHFRCLFEFLGNSFAGLGDMTCKRVEEFNRNKSKASPYFGSAKSNWRIIPTEIIEEMVEAYGMTAGEILYLIGMDEMPSDMAEALETMLESTDQV